MNYVASSSTTGGSPEAATYVNGTSAGYYSMGSNGTLRSQYSTASSSSRPKVEEYNNNDPYATYGTVKKYPPPVTNGMTMIVNDDDGASNGFDSGHGSSLDRNYDSFGRNGYGKSRGGGSNGQYYLNLPPPKDPKANGTLDHREHRGSAFELYKKPLEYSVR